MSYYYNDYDDDAYECEVPGAECRVFDGRSYYYNDYDDEDAYECPVCDRVFDNGPNWRANKNSMEMHLQVKLYHNV